MCVLSYRTYPSKIRSMVTWQEKVRLPRWAAAGKFTLSDLIMAIVTSVAILLSLSHSVGINFTTSFLSFSARFSLTACKISQRSKIFSTRCLAISGESTWKNSSASTQRWLRRCSSPSSFCFRTLCRALKTSTATRKTSKSTSLRKEPHLKTPLIRLDLHLAARLKLLPALASWVTRLLPRLQSNRASTSTHRVPRTCLRTLPTEIRARLRSPRPRVQPPPTVRSMSPTSDHTSKIRSINEIALKRCRPWLRRARIN